ncbi:alpha/beta hydrolase [Synechocystis sp. FACHB-383]|nr:alpha/beta hydrolase [Synechocystis sp. FACHB-383]
MFTLKRINQHYFISICTLCFLGITSPASLMPKAQAAETIDFVYDSIQESLKITSLEKFVADGTIDNNLGFYFGLLNINETEQQQFREILTKQIDISPVLLSRLLKTDEGERLLDFFGNIIEIQGGRNGAIALRGAIISAAFSPDGLTLINFLENLPVDVQIDIRQSLKFAQNIDIVVKGTEIFVDKVAELSAKEAQQSPPIDYSQLPDLTTPGKFTFTEQKWMLEDKNRNRKFYALVYQPNQWRQPKTPVVVISHGLSSNPEYFQDKARHLASYGFFVIAPQHPGSDETYKNEFEQGYYADVSDVNEFINRPLDISFTLDELEKRNQTEFDGKLDLENVGLYGHSYGGYTVLALAGATPAPNFQQLEQDCNKDLSRLNTALLLECRALNLERQSQDFRDERVKAVIAANPVNASIFGQEGMGKIQIPIAIGAGSYDPATPFIFEQIRSFPWLTTPHRYLFLEEGQTHIDLSKLDGGMSKLMAMIPKVKLPSPQLISRYGRAEIIAFFEVYLAQKPDFLPYLDPAHAAYLSEGEEFKAYLITQKSAAELIQAVSEFKREHGIE